MGKVILMHPHSLLIKPSAKYLKFFSDGDYQRELSSTIKYGYGPIKLYFYKYIY